MSNIAEVAIEYFNFRKQIVVNSNVFKLGNKSLCKLVSLLWDDPAVRVHFYYLQQYQLIDYGEIQVLQPFARF